MARILPGYTHLFLYDISDKVMYALFEATELPALNLEPHAWTRPWPLRDPEDAPAERTRYAAQCRVQLSSFMPTALPRRAFLHLLRSDGGSRFDAELTADETHALLTEFVLCNESPATGGAGGARR